MAFRGYFPLDEAADVSPAISATDWGHIATNRRKLLATPDASALTTVGPIPNEGSHHTDINTQHRQYISDPMAAQTITGTVKAQIQCNQASTANNQFLTLKIWVCSNDGSTERGVLLAVQRDDVEMLGFPASDTAQNRSFGPYSLSSVDAEEDDRLVIEIGSGGQPVDVVGTQDHDCWLRWGCDAASGDLPEDNTAHEGTPPGGAYRPWIEFSQDIFEPIAEDYVNVCVIT